MSLRGFVEAGERSEFTLAVVNRESPPQLVSMLERTFADQSVEVTDIDVEGAETDQAFLFDGQELLATSSLQELQESLLLINSDLFITGSRGMGEIEVPDVISELQNVRFRLQGFPESNREKLLLILLSRHIEQLALANGEGKQRSSFQRLSRIHDEHGTKRVYEQLGGSDVDTHIYGLPDWTPNPEFDVTMHAGWSEEFENSWFVVHVPEDENADHAALVAVEDRPRVWEGMWTFDAERVRAINRYIEREL